MISYCANNPSQGIVRLRACIIEVILGGTDPGLCLDRVVSTVSTHLEDETAQILRGRYRGVSSPVVKPRHILVVLQDG